METVLENGPPIGWHTFSSDLICQKMPPTLLTLNGWGEGADSARPLLHASRGHFWSQMNL